MLRIVHSEYWAEDLLQNIFTKLWTGRQSLAGVDNPGGYLYRMAANIALDYMKHQAVALKAQYWIAQQQLYSSQGEAEQKVDYKLFETWIREATQRMPPQRKLVYQLKQEGMTNEQIAERLQLSPHTVRNHLVAAQQFIRDYIIDKGDLLLLVFLFTEYFL